MKYFCSILCINLVRQMIELKGINLDHNLYSVVVKQCRTVNKCVDGSPIQYLYLFEFSYELDEILLILYIIYVRFFKKIFIMLKT